MLVVHLSLIQLQFQITLGQLIQLGNCSTQRPNHPIGSIVKAQQAHKNVDKSNGSTYKGVLLKKLVLYPGHKHQEKQIKTPHYAYTHKYRLPEKTIQHKYCSRTGKSNADAIAH